MSRLESDALAMIAMIDRSEHVDLEYAVVEGALTERPVTMVEIPPWDPTGTGPYSVAAQIEFCRPLMAGALFCSASSPRVSPSAWPS